MYIMLLRKNNEDNYRGIDRKCPLYWNLSEDNQQIWDEYIYISNGGGFIECNEHNCAIVTALYEYLKDIVDYIVFSKNEILLSNAFEYYGVDIVTSDYSYSLLSTYGLNNRLRNEYFKSINQRGLYDTVDEAIPLIEYANSNPDLFEMGTPYIPIKVYCKIDANIIRIID